MDYDVFISCKSEDYKYAGEIYDYLKKNDIHAFLASKELRQMGESEYRRAISKAIKSAYHIIVFASKAEFIDSTWVYYEWDMFLNAKLNGRKEGQILTILKDVEVGDINMDLWKYESFTSENYTESILSYVETPASQFRKEQTKRKAQEEAERRISQIKRDIKESEVEYFRCSDNLSRLAKDIVDKLKEIGENKKVCPVCNESTYIDSTYCRKCGWTFIPIFSTKTFASEEHLFIARKNWDSISKESNAKNIAQIEDMQNKYLQAMAEITQLKEERARLLELNKILENTCKANVTDFTTSENVGNFLDIANITKEVGISVFKKAAKTLFVNPDGLSSPNTKEKRQESSYAKLNKYNLVDTILKCCSHSDRFIFGMDKLVKVGFNETKFREIMKTTYGMTFGTDELSTCKTVENLKQLVAKRAKIKID